MSCQEAEPDGKAICSFCGKTEDEVGTIIKGPDAGICDECVDLCSDIVAASNEQEVTDTDDAGSDLWCRLCQLPIYVDGDSVAIPNRGRLCLACIDAIRSVLGGVYK